MYITGISLNVLFVRSFANRSGHGEELEEREGAGLSVIGILMRSENYSEKENDPGRY
jgi:hypothetical protein